MLFLNLWGVILSAFVDLLVNGKMIPFSFVRGLLSEKAHRAVRQRHHPGPNPGGSQRLPPAPAPTPAHSRLLKAGPQDGYFIFLIKFY